jgi:molybdopterin molybdotransferase
VLKPAEAEKLIRQHLVRLPVESLPLAQCSGAVLREDIHAERDQPPFDRVTMDGIAFDSGGALEAGRALRIQSTQAAGEPPHTLNSRDACIEVMTGAVLPAGCDVVVPVEDIQVADGRATISPTARIEARLNVHPRASDIEQGALLLSAGTALGAPEVAVAASAGKAHLRVSAQPAIVVISTGNELVEPGEAILPHQIRRSNAYGIAAALRQRGFHRVADDHIADDAAELRARLKFHLETHDALVLSGGVSMGKFDLVPKVLEELGVRLVFHRVEQRPGKPLWFGVARSGTAVFALPGNPVSTLVCLARYVIPGLFEAMSLRDPAVERIALGEAVSVKSPLTFFLPVRLEHDDAGQRWALPRPTNGSGDFTSLAGTQGFVELPPGPATHPRGFVTRLYRW